MNYILFSTLEEEDCSQLNSSTGIAVGIIIIIAMFLSYVPQYQKIIKSKSSEDISNYYILLYNITNFTNFYGTLLINFRLVNCCLHISSDKCMNLLLPLYQMFTPWFCVFILYILFLVYDNHNHICNRNFYQFIFFNSFFVIILGILGMCFLIKYSEYQKNVKQFGDGLNIVSTITCIVCLLPQIYKTYKEKQIGNLSIMSLALQAPGSFIVFVYQYYIIHAPISIGIPYLFGFILQVILLAECIYYTRYYKKNYELIVNYENYQN